MASQNRIPSLDGIRGLAILLVIAYHYFVFFAAFPLGSWPARAGAGGRLFWSGVDLFFVLSGYLIGGILLDARESPNYFKVFYVRRAYRILPLYAAALALGLLAPPLSDNLIPAWAYLTLTQNFYTAAAGTFGAAWLGVTWSLAIEEQFYLAAPWLVRRLSARGLALAVGLSVVAAPALRVAAFVGLPHGWTAAYVLPFCRMDALMMGVGAALLVRDPGCSAWLSKNRRLLFFPAALCGGALLLFTMKNWVQPSFQMASFGYSVVALFYLSLLLLVVTGPTSALARLFSLRPLTFVGVRAYGLYLAHISVLYLVSGFAPRMAGAGDALKALSAFALALLVASLSWEYFEKPLVRMGHRHRYGDVSARPTLRDRLFPAHQHRCAGPNSWDDRQQGHTWKCRYCLDPEAAERLCHECAGRELQIY